MSDKTKIEWTDATWSPIRVRVKQDAAVIAREKGYTSLVQIAEKMAGRVGPHCEHVSPGCLNCYAGTNNHRCLPGNGTGLPYDRRSRDLVETFIDEKILLKPLSWKQPKKIFVENQSDLFGEWVPDEMIDRVFAVMALCPQHTFQVLTKRPERMLDYLNGAPGRLADVIEGMRFDTPRRAVGPLPHLNGGERWFPLANVWLGVSCENQKAADERIPLLLQTPAAVRFISAEPLLGAIRLARWTDEGLECECGWSGIEAEASEAGPEDDPGFACPKCGELCMHTPLDERLGDALNWVIVGGESGPGARPCDVDWIRGIVQQCKAASVPVFVKQLGANSGRFLYSRARTREWVEPWLNLQDRKGGDIEEFPEDLRVREFPAERITNGLV